MNKRHWWLASFSVCAAAASVAAVAQVQRSGGENQKFMQQYQQMAAEKTALQAQVAQMKKELDTAKSDLAATKKERDALKARAGAAASAAATVAQLTASKEVRREEPRSLQAADERAGREIS